VTDGAAVITAIYGGYETVKHVLPQDGLDIDWVLVTDGPGYGDTAQGWRVVFEPRPGTHPNRAAKRPKMLPWEYTLAPVSVWADASYQITSPGFVAGALACADPIAQHPHPSRDCLYDEATHSAALAKYAGEPLEEQAAHYRQAGHPEHWGLWAAGVIARRHTPQVRDFGAAWLAEVEAWTFQDQVSQPYALRSCGLRPCPFPGTYLDGRWLAHSPGPMHL